MGEKFQLKGGKSEVNFGYHSKIGGYTTLVSDILKLAKIGRCRFYDDYVNASCRRLNHV